MAQPARITPLPGTGDDRRDSTEWMHDLTPTLSDKAMFDEDGHIQPLQVWPTESTKEKPKSELHLVRKEDRPVKSDR